MLESVCLALGILAAVALFASALAALSAHQVLSRPIDAEPAPDAPAAPLGQGRGISVLKPLKGLEDGLYENLASFARQDHLNAEILFGAEDPDDPALAVARCVQREHPLVAIRVVVCGGARGRNPKVRILSVLAGLARHELLLISDSNVRVQQSYLRETAAELRDPAVGLVTNVVAGVAPDRESLGSLLENLHLDTFVVGATALARVVAGRACVVGKSMLLRRSDLERLGGFRSVRNVLAEDYLLGRKFEKAGLRVVLSPHVVTTVNETWPVSRFLARHLRWAQLRRRVSPAAFCLELALNPMLALALLLAARRGRPGTLEGLLMAAGFFYKLALDARLAGRMRGAPLRLRELAWLPVKDLLIAALWPLAAVKRTVRWRGNDLRIGAATRLLRPRRDWASPLFEALLPASPDEKPREIAAAG